MRSNSGFQQLPSGLWVPGPSEEALRRLEIDEQELRGVPRGVSIANQIRATLAGDSILVTPGLGATVATHTVNSKEHQVVMLARHDGHIIGSKDDWFAYYTPVTNANNREVAEIFNADAAVIVRVRGVWLIPTFTAITGAQIGFALNRISAVGTTSSTVITPRPSDKNFSALDADITCRFGSTAGATLDHLIFAQYTLNEETNAGFAITPWMNLLPVMGDHIVDVTLRQNQGLQLKQIISNTVGLTGAIFYFTVE